MCLLDVSKDFDTVSHNSMVALAERVGDPKMHTKYIMHTYYDCSTQLKYKNGVLPSIPVNRGVKPVLFNSIIDYVTDNMPGNINLQGKSKISHMAFADDLVLLAKYNVMMKNQVYHVLFRLTQCVLKIKYGWLIPYGIYIYIYIYVFNTYTFVIIVFLRYVMYSLENAID